MTMHWKSLHYKRFYSCGIGAIAQKRFFVLGAGSMIAATLQIASSIILARLLGPIERGHFAEALAVTGITATIVLFGLDAVLARVAARQSTGPQPPLLIGFTYCVALLPFLGAVFGLFHVGPWYLFALLTTTSMLSIISQSIYLGAGLYVHHSTVRLLVHVFVLLAVLSLAFITLKTHIAVMWMYIIANILAILLATFVHQTQRPNGNELKLSETVANIGNYLLSRETLLSWGANVTNAAQLFLPVSIISKFLSPADAAFYVIAKNTMAPSGILADALTRLGAAEGAQGQRMKMSHKVMRIFSVFGGGVLALCVSYPLIPIFYGNDFISARYYMLLYFFANVAEHASLILSETHRFSGKSIIALIGRLIGIIILATGTLITWIVDDFYQILIPIIINAASITTLIALFLGLARPK